eukprot:SAG11_NODE_28661_length_319_cov_0.850000_1_plen_76_part_10
MAERERREEEATNAEFERHLKEREEAERLHKEAEASAKRRAKEEAMKIGFGQRRLGRYTVVPEGERGLSATLRPDL